MNKIIRVFGTAIVAAIAAFLALIFSGLGTTSIADVNGFIHSYTTVNFGVNEFGIIIIAVVLISVIVAGLIFNIKDKN